MEDLSNYQLVIKTSNNERVIFTGVTDLCATDVVTKCARMLVDYDKLDFYTCLESFIYQPIKNEEETK